MPISWFCGRDAPPGCCCCFAMHPGRAVRKRDGDLARGELAPDGDHNDDGLLFCGPRKVARTTD